MDKFNYKAPKRTPKTPITKTSANTQQVKKSWTDRSDDLNMSLAGNGQGIKGWIRMFAYAEIFMPFSLFVCLVIAVAFPFISFAPAAHHGLVPKVLSLIVLAMCIYGFFNHDFAYVCMTIVSWLMIFTALTLFTTLCIYIVYLITIGILRDPDFGYTSR